MEPELEKLRRFCLVIALVLITYELAGVRVASSEHVSLLGLPLAILHPEWIPVGLFIASIYSTTRFWYYAFLLKSSPRKKRKQFLSRFQTFSREPGKYRADQQSAKEYARLLDQVEEVFPQFPRTRATIKEIQVVSDRYDLLLELPRRISRAAWFEDFDYASPILLNIVAYVVGVFSLFCGRP